jgi:hypothetical protein
MSTEDRSMDRLEQQIRVALQNWNPHPFWHSKGWCVKACALIHDVFEREQEPYPDLGPFPGARKKR